MRDPLHTTSRILFDTLAKFENIAVGKNPIKAGGSASKHMEIKLNDDMNGFGIAFDTKVTALFPEQEIGHFLTPQGQMAFLREFEERVEQKVTEVTSRPLDPMVKKLAPELKDAEFSYSLEELWETDDPVPLLSLKGYPGLHGQEKTPLVFVKFLREVSEIFRDPEEIELEKLQEHPTFIALKNLRDLSQLFYATNRCKNTSDLRRTLEIVVKVLETCIERLPSLRQQFAKPTIKMTQFTSQPIEEMLALLRVGYSADMTDHQIQNLLFHRLVNLYWGKMSIANASMIELNYGNLRIFNHF